MNFIIPVFFAIAACSCGGKENADTTEEASVSVTPASLECDAHENILTLNVTASGAFQAYAGDGVDWVSVDPSYSKESSATVTVKVSENLNFKDRSTDITVKCGTTRKKVTLTQAAAKKGETSIDIPEGYHLDWQEEFNVDGKPNASDWWYETGGGGWGNNEEQVYVAGSQGGDRKSTRLNSSH